MPAELVPVRPAPGPLDAAPAARLAAAFFAGRSPHTLRAYQRDLEDFARFAGGATAEDAGRLLLAGGQGPANERALRYRAALLGRGLAPATVNRRLAALRSMVKLARTLGLVPWALDVDGVRSEGYRDTRGPGRDGFRQLLAQLQGRADAKGARDRAVLRLLYDLGLRRAEVCRLDRQDLDLGQGSLAVLGKGRREKVRLALPGPTREALAAWLAFRGDGPGPLFVRLDRGGTGRLTGGSVYALVRQLGDRAGLTARPHGLRHAAITRVLELTGGNVREAQQFSRHQNVATVLKYDDARRDRAGDLARRLADDAEDA
jgi:integrase/recombinase XerC